MLCPHCGRDSDPLFRFCLHCGKELTAKAEAPAPKPDPKPAAAPAAHQAAQATDAEAEAPEPDTGQPEPVDSAAKEPPAEPAREEPDATQRCPRCRAKLGPDAEVCPMCGHSLVEPHPVSKGDFVKERETAQISLKRPVAGYLISVSSVDGRETVKVPLYQGKNSLGRESCDISFPEDDLLSPSHLMLMVDSKDVALDCQASRNGTYVRMTDQEKLDHGDLFRLGQQLLRFEDLEKFEPLVKPAEEGTQVLGSPAGPKAWGRLTQVITEQESGSSFLLTSENVFLGRERGNITFPGDRYISGTHAVVARRADGTFLRDVGSSNGTYIRVKGNRNISSGQYFLAGRQLFKLFIAD